MINGDRTKTNTPERINEEFNPIKKTSKYKKYLKIFFLTLGATSIDQNRKGIPATLNRQTEKLIDNPKKVAKQTEMTLSAENSRTRKYIPTNAKMRTMKSRKK